nr:GNAT family N-acetyltransferase [Enterococcus sp. 669A]
MIRSDHVNIKFRAPIEKDIDDIMAIENAGFSPEEAGTREAMLERIRMIGDSFIVAVKEEDDLLGYAVGPVIPERYLYDELFEKTIPNPKTGGYQSVLSLAVAPNYRKFRIGSMLLEELAKVSKEQDRTGITLTCLENLIPFYEKNGYKTEGISDSQHAGEIWYNMVLDL